MKFDIPGTSQPADSAGKQLSSVIFPHQAGRSFLQIAFGKFPGALMLGLLAITVSAQEWKPVPEHIMTRWAAQVNPKSPLPEYPRPQMMHPEWVNLNGLWDYAIQLTEGASATEHYDGKILVPFPIESALSGVHRMLAPTNRLWYRRSFKSPDLKGGKRLLLHFGAVDWEAKAFINGKSVGEHRGGYDPFSFDITEAIKPGSENELILKVYDPGTSTYQPDGKQNLSPFIATKPRTRGTLTLDL